MRCYEGYLEGHGDSDSFLGGTRYKYIRLRKMDGTVENIQHIIAYPNVEAQIDHILATAEFEDQIHVKIYTKGGLYIYALDNSGTLYTDYPMIRSAWLFGMVKTFGFLVISLLLFLSGDHSMAVGGIVFLLVGAIMFLTNISGTILLWPSSKAGRLKSTTRAFASTEKAA